MSVVTRLRQAKQKQQEAENAMPGGYNDRQAADIDAALGRQAEANDAGVAGLADEALRQYRQRVQTKAADGAGAATRTAQSLGGSGSTGWMDTVANQTAAAQRAAPDNTPTALRAQALEQWQAERNDTNSLLDALMTQSGIERSEYDGQVADAQTMRDWRVGRTEAAQNASDNFWNTVWNTAKGLGGAVRGAYDAYQGYTGQRAQAISMAQELKRNGNEEGAKALLKMYRLDENMLDNLQGLDNVTKEQFSVLQDCMELKKQGAPAAMIDYYLGQSGLDRTMLDQWDGLSETDKERLNYMVTASGLAGSGDDTAARNFLTLAGLDPNAVGSYAGISANQNKAELAQYAAKKALDRQYATSSASGGRSSSSSGSYSGSSAGSTGSGTGSKYNLTTSQLVTISKAFQNMGEGDAMYDTYKDILQDAGWLAADSTDTGSTAGSSASGGAGRTSAGSSTGTGTSRLPYSGVSRTTPYKTSGTADSTSGASTSFAQSQNRNAAGGNFDTALNRALDMANNGYSYDQISDWLLRSGYSDNVISRVSNVMGW